MAAATETFGHARDGGEVQLASIGAGGLKARVLSLGATLQDLRLDGHADPLVLGFERLEHYLDHGRFHGAIVGRNANRIREGRFAIDGERFQVAEGADAHALHGGPFGLHHRHWGIEALGADHVALALVDPHEPDGFPGNLAIRCAYRVRAPATLVVELEATTDRTTPCNLAHHSYFNLDNGGATDILDHRLVIDADAYLPTDLDRLPTGHVRPVEATAFDFLPPRPIRLQWEAETMAYDHNFCLAARRGELRRAAWVQGPSSGVEMEVWTTEPGLQFFDGEIEPSPVPGLGGRRYGSRAGFCLEPQLWPDWPNHRHFPQGLLRPGETYRQVSEFRFGLVSL